MGVRFDRLRYEVFQNLFLSPMNTGSVRPAVATTPTACGIETLYFPKDEWDSFKLQQHLPLAVLKLSPFKYSRPILTLQQHLPLAVLKQSF